MRPATPLPTALRRTLFVYNLLFPFVLVALLPGLIRRMMRRGNYREHFGQRLGKYQPQTHARFRDGAWLWIHSISVGETLVALKLARALRQQDPLTGIVISVTTSTGFALALQQKEPWMEVLYNPLDLLSVVNRALDLIRPTRLIFVEGEAWPNLSVQARLRDIPLALVNARLSPRSEARFRKFKQWTGPIFRALDFIGVPESTDVARWTSLGVAPECLRHTGSIKYDLAIADHPSRGAEFRALLAPLGVNESTPILVAGSTWAPEERALAELLLELRRQWPDLFLILVPRHVERTPEILRTLAPLNLRIQKRSDIREAEPCDILLVDTTGELRDWYALATVIFVGKSLPGVSEIGGQNPAEPAALGKPVVVGPHMENFGAVMELLLGRDAIVQVPDAAELGDSIRKLFGDPAVRQGLSDRAQEALLLHQQATQRTAVHVLALRVRANLEP